MMHVIVLNKWHLGMFFLLLVFLAALSVYYPAAQVGTDGYRIRNAYPPLVFLPGYLNGPPVHASASILVESKTGAVLFAKNPEERRAPASTTKMMTAIVALEKGNLNQVIKVSQRAANTPGSSIYLRPGDNLTLGELLKGMMMQSGNDGSMAVAEGISGNMERFVQLMNLKAKEIGALKTNFRNPHGLRAPSHYTTALDLAIIARYGMTNPKFADIVRQRAAKLEWVKGASKELPIQNTNRLLWYLEGADGVKTGTTNEAGRCLVASATRKSKQLIAVVLNSSDRWGDCSRLLDYGFQEFTTVRIADHRTSICRLRVEQGRENWIELYPRWDLLAEVRRGQLSTLTRQIRVSQQPVLAPIKAGQILGRIDYQYQGQRVEGVDLISRRSVERKSVGWKWWFQ